MALLNPIYAFIVPFLIIFTIPLAIFAGITTSIAFFVLFCRVVVVYLDIAFALLPQYLGVVPGLGSLRHRHVLVRYTAVTSMTSSPLVTTPSTSPAKPYFAHSRRHSRRPSLTEPHAFLGARSGSEMPGIIQDQCPNKGESTNHPYLEIPPTTPAHSAVSIKLPTPVSEPQCVRRRPSSVSNISMISTVSPTSECSFGIAPSVGIDRDFEGVGGWRINEPGDDKVWTTMNSCLELPDRHQPSNGFNHSGVHHYRTRSAGAGTLTPGGTLMGIDGHLPMRAINRSAEGMGGFNMSRPRAPCQDPGPITLTPLYGDE